MWLRAPRSKEEAFYEHDQLDLVIGARIILQCRLGAYKHISIGTHSHNAEHEGRNINHDDTCCLGLLLPSTCYQSPKKTDLSKKNLITGAIIKVIFKTKMDPSNLD